MSINRRTAEAIKKLTEIELELLRLNSALDMADRDRELKREWVGLTDEEISSALGFGEFTVPATRNALTAIARAIEDALKEKNT